MDADQIDTLQSHVIFGMFCSAVLSTFQPGFKYSQAEFYQSLYIGVMTWNLLGTVYFVLRLAEYLRRVPQPKWYILIKVLETLLWVLPVCFVGHEGGLLAKKYIVGELYIACLTIDSC